MRREIRGDAMRVLRTIAIHLKGLKEDASDEGRSQHYDESIVTINGTNRHMIYFIMPERMLRVAMAS